MTARSSSDSPAGRWPQPHTSTLADNLPIAEAVLGVPAGDDHTLARDRSGRRRSRRRRRLRRSSQSRFRYQSSSLGGCLASPMARPRADQARDACRQDPRRGSARREARAACRSRCRPRRGCSPAAGSLEDLVVACGLHAVVADVACVVAGVGKPLRDQRRKRAVDQGRRHASVSWRSISPALPEIAVDAPERARVPQPAKQTVAVRSCLLCLADRTRCD